MIDRAFVILTGYKTFEVISGILTHNTNHNSLQLTELFVVLIYTHAKETLWKFSITLQVLSLGLPRHSRLLRSIK